MSRALRIAHRGDWRAGPENGLAAIRAALANPACDGLEFDVRGSRDGVPVLLHDPTLERVQGRPERPDELTARELAALGVPALDAILALVGAGPFLDVELKGEPVAAVLSVLEAARGPGLERTVVSSFDAGTLAWVGARRPGWRRWLNADRGEPAVLEQAAALGCSGVSLAWQTLGAGVVARAAVLGLEVAAWTVRRRATARRLERLGVAVLCVEAGALDG